MPQLVKKRRSGWAVLAAGALVASILAVGAAPAAAQSAHLPDAEAQWKACLGPALEGHGFEDVAMDSVHYDNINCLAYYGITKGKTAETFNPQGNVTRSQMALFLARAADKAGIDLGDATDQGFTDLGGSEPERVAAINQLVGAGIMFGNTQTAFDPPSATVFAPSDPVTRWEMAMFLFEFLNHALDSVIIDSLPNSVENNTDGVGHVELNSSDGETGTAPNDFFGDARRNTPYHVNDRISAIYELGITTGTNGMVGEAGTFEPNGLVTRAQMASFIMRTMGHTNLRPAGLTAQSTSSDTMVSVRSADFAPVADVSTDVFTTNFPDDAFDRSDRCISRYVQNQDPSYDECRIDVGDLRTGDDGNALWEGVGLQRGNPLTVTCSVGTYTFASAGRGGATDYTVYAWQGNVGNIVDDVEDLFKSVAANTLSTRDEATQAEVTGGTALHVKMGGSVTYTVQLQDDAGNDVGPTPGANNTFQVRVQHYYEDSVDSNTFGSVDFSDRTSNLQPDGSGSFTFTVDANAIDIRGTNQVDVLARITVTASTGTTITIVDSATDNATHAATLTEHATVWFSDDDSAPTSIDGASAPWRLIGSSARNSVSVTVSDQYGDLYRGADHAVLATDTSFAPSGPTVAPAFDGDGGTAGVQPYDVNATGRVSIPYTVGSLATSLQTITLQLQDSSSAAVGSPDSPTVVWARLGLEGSQTLDATVTVTLGDPGSNYVVINRVSATTNDDVAGGYFAYGYGDDDRFVVEGDVVTMDQFEEILGALGDAMSGVTGGTLSWVGYDLSRPRDGASWTLSGLTCPT